MRRLFWMLLVLSCMMPAARGHEVTFSRIDIYLEPDRTEIQLNLPILALTFEEPSSLPEGTTDATLQTDPIPPDAQLAIQQLVTTRLLLRSDGRLLPLTLSGVAAGPMEVSLTATAPPAHGLIEVDANLFPADLLNKAFVSVYASNEVVGQYALDRTNHVFEMEGIEPPVSRGLHNTALDALFELIRPEYVLALVALAFVYACEKQRTMRSGKSGAIFTPARAILIVGVATALVAIVF